MTARWAEVKGLFQADAWGAEGPYSPKAKMAFMATYNLERFREFVFESSFLRSFQIDKKSVFLFETDDVELLKFAFNWLAFALFGKKTMKLKPAVGKARKKAMGRR